MRWLLCDTPYDTARSSAAPASAATWSTFGSLAENVLQPQSLCYAARPRAPVLSILAAWHGVVAACVAGRCCDKAAMGAGMDGVTCDEQKIEHTQ